MARKEKTKPPVEVWEVREPHACEVNGEKYALRIGDRVPEGHPTLLANRHFFRPFAEPTVGLARAIRDEPRTEPPPPKPERMFRARRNLRLSGVSFPGGLTAPGMTVIQEGEVLPESHPAVSARRKDFKLVK
jgi:hypothetical protein